MMPNDRSSTVYMRCQRCGTIALTNELYCFSCGTLLTYICEGCGLEHSHIVANYCPYCGRTIQLDDPIGSDLV